MAPRLRFSVRSLLALVAVVALILVSAFEIGNHVRRDRQFSKVMSKFMASSWHYREAMNCKGRGGPYTPAERSKENSGYYPGLPAHVTSWAMESSFHE